jgi:integrase/recombinase XerC
MDNDEALGRFDAYVRRRSPGRRTPVDYVSDVRQFQRACPKCWDAVTTADIDAFVDQMRGAGRKAATIRRRVTALKVYFDFVAEEEDRLDHANPVSLPRHGGRADRHLPRGLSDAEVARLLAVVTHKRDRALVLLMLRGGLRVSEAVGLRMDDLWLPVAPQVPARLRVLGKGRKERIVYLSPVATRALLEWLSIRPVCETLAVFVSDRQRPLSVAGVQWLLKGYGREIGTHLTPHRLRHTCARQLIEARMPVESLAQLLGHAQISTTQIYLEGADMGLREAFMQAMQRIESTVPVPVQGVGTGSEGKVTAKARPAAGRSAEPACPPLPDGRAWATDLPQPIRQACLRYVQRHAPTWRASQRRIQAQNVLGAFASFWRWVAARHVLNRVADLAASDVHAYIDDRLSQGLKASSVNMSLTRMLSLLREVAEEGEPVAPSLFRIKHLQRPDPLPRALTDEEARRLEAQAEEWLARGTAQAVRDATCFFLLAHTGLRAAELVDLRRNDVDLERKTLHLSGKGGHDRVVYLTDTAIQALQCYLRLWPEGPEALLFRGTRGARLGREALRRRLNALAAEAQVAHVSPHRLRHTLATRLINAGMAITDLQKLLGHDRLSTTQIYARVYDATVERDYRRAMARLQAEPSAATAQLAALPSFISKALEAVTLDNSV